MRINGSALNSLALNAIKDNGGKSVGFLAFLPISCTTGADLGVTKPLSGSNPASMVSTGSAYLVNTQSASVGSSLNVALAETQVTKYFGASSRATLVSTAPIELIKEFGSQRFVSAKGSGALQKTDTLSAGASVSGVLRGDNLFITTLANASQASIVVASSALEVTKSFESQQTSVANTTGSLKKTVPLDSSNVVGLTGQVSLSPIVTFASNAKGTAQVQSVSIEVNKSLACSLTGRATCTGNPYKEAVLDGLANVRLSTQAALKADERLEAALSITGTLNGEPTLTKRLGGSALGKATHLARFERLNELSASAIATTTVVGNNTVLATFGPGPLVSQVVASADLGLTKTIEATSQSSANSYSGNLSAIKTFGSSAQVATGTVSDLGLVKTIGGASSSNGHSLANLQSTKTLASSKSVGLTGAAALQQIKAFASEARSNAFVAASQLSVSKTLASSSNATSASTGELGGTAFLESAGSGFARFMASLESIRVLGAAEKASAFTSANLVPTRLLSADSGLSGSAVGGIRLDKALYGSAVSSSAGNSNIKVLLKNVPKQFLRARVDDGFIAVTALPHYLKCAALVSNVFMLVDADTEVMN